MCLNGCERQDSNLRSFAYEANEIVLFSTPQWIQGEDLNLRPLGYEPSKLPDCSTLQYIILLDLNV